MTAAHTRYGCQVADILLFSVFGGHKTKWSGRGYILVRFWRHCPVIIGQNIKVWVEHCPTGVMTSCTLFALLSQILLLVFVAVGGFILKSGTVDGLCELVADPLWEGSTGTGC